VIKIRYSSELKPGLHGRAEHFSRSTVVYLLPALTSVQRAAALRRLRQESRLGIGPRLPVCQLVLALLADRAKAACNQAGAVVRTHPAGSALPVVAVSAAAALFLVLSAVSIHIVRTPEAAGGGAAGGIAPTVSTGPGPTQAGNHGSHGSHGSAPAGPGTAPGGSQRPGTGGHRAGQSPGPGPSTGSPSSPSPGTSPLPVTSPSPAGGSGSGGSTLSSAGATSPPPTAPATASSSPAAPAASSSPKPASSRNGVCVDVGSLGICLSL
jgi:hypothetical protein